MVDGSGDGPSSSLVLDEVDGCGLLCLECGLVVV
jgi:hypothetical protein